MGLELYAIIEEYLDFKDEVARLHNKFLELVKLAKAKSVIDIGCGQGAFLELLNSSGIQNLGIDLSENQIQIAAAKSLNVKCEKIENIGQKFHIATAIFDVVNYIKPNDLEMFFKSVYDILDDDGSFVFDVNSKFAFEEIVEGSIVIDREEKFIAIDANFSNPILTTQIILFEKQKDNSFIKSADKILQYFHTKDTIIKTAKKAGFISAKSTGFNLHGFSDDDKIIFTLIKKP